MNSVFLIAEQNRVKIAEEMKKASGYYPKVITMNVDEVTYVSTLVRIERGGIWYVVHCMESFVLNQNTQIEHCLYRFIDSVHKIQNLYQLTGRFEEKDKLQISEVERLINTLSL